MSKLLVLTCLLVSCLAGPLDLQSYEPWINAIGIRGRDPGCADRLMGWMACARIKNSSALVLAPHPYDCSLFYYCLGAGAWPICRRCPLGLHYNSVLQVCDWPQDANCTAKFTPPVDPRYNTTVSSPTPAANVTEAWSTPPNETISDNAVDTWSALRNETTAIDAMDAWTTPSSVTTNVDAKEATANASDATANATDVQSSLSTETTTVQTTDDLTTLTTANTDTDAIDVWKTTTTHRTTTSTASPPLPPPPPAPQTKPTVWQKIKKFFKRWF